MRISRVVVVGALAVTAVACSDRLNVSNENSPDAARALARPTDVENLVGSSYFAVHDATLGDATASGGGANDAIEPQAICFGLESYSNLGNFDMGIRCATPRIPIDNTRGNPGLAGNYRDWLNLHKAARQAAVGLGRLNDPTFTFFPPNAAQLARDKAFAHFVIGAALGDIALIYDQGSAISPTDPPTGPALPLIAYDTLMRYALAELDSAVAIGGAAGAASAFPTPGSWFDGLALTQAQFVAFVRAYRARFRAGVARTAADRAAADWTTIRNDALAGAAAFPADFNLPIVRANGWDVAWPIQHYASISSNWHMMWQFMMGMADTSGAYQAWLATPQANRLPFVVVTPDTRFPPGTTRNAQTQASCGSLTACGSALPAGMYFRNRPTGLDWSGEPLASSFYDHYRFFGFYLAGRNGNYPIFTTAEMNMLAAEGYIRQSNFDAAAALINLTRTAHGLPALPNGMTAASVVPGGAACVPKFTTDNATAQCGTILEAMKWEKRIEGAFTGPYMWYTDSRGWGDLPEGTALMWPTPYQEIDTRQSGANPPGYTNYYGGAGGQNAAPKGTYGI